MNLELFRYEENKPVEIIEEIDTSNFTFPTHYKIVKIDSCKVKVRLTRFEMLTHARIEVTGSLTALCSYSGELFSFPYHTIEEMSFSDCEEDESSFYEPNDTINLDPYIIAIIDNLVPINVTKPGAKKPNDGDGYRVLSEDDLAKERSSTKDSRWAKLDEIDLDK